MPLLMIQAQQNEPQWFFVNGDGKQSLHLSIDMRAECQNLIEGRTAKARAQLLFRNFMSQGVVIAIEEPLKLIVKRFVCREEWPQDESFEEPGCMRLMPLHRTGFGARLYHLIFRREILNDSLGLRPHSLVFRVERGQFFLQLSGPIIKMSETF